MTSVIYKDKWKFMKSRVTSLEDIGIPEDFNFLKFSMMLRNFLSFIINLAEVFKKN